MWPARPIRIRRAYLSKSKMAVTVFELAFIWCSMIQIGLVGGRASIAYQHDHAINSDGDDGGLTSHPALVPHARALSEIAVTSRGVEHLDDRVHLWDGLRSKAALRGNKLAGGRVGSVLPFTGGAHDHAIPAHVQRRLSNTPLPSSTSSSTPAPSNGVINPCDYGADPTGRTDSTTAILASVTALLQLGSSRNRSTLSSNITDLAGAVLDLQGGEYLISSPVIIPMFFGNFYIQGGTLRASSTFPSDGYLITIGHTGCDPDYAASCNEFIGISRMLLDASHTAAGGVNIISSMGVSVGPAVFVERFSQVGIKIDGGHETLVHQAWFVETYWNNLPNPKPPGPSSGGPYLTACDGSDAQRWTNVTTPSSRKEIYTVNALQGSIVSLASGKCICVDGCQAPGENTDLLMWECVATLPGNDCNGTNQQWVLDIETGQLITKMNKGLCLEAPNMRLEACDASNPGQRWQLSTNGTLTNALEKGCMSIPGHGPVPPTPPAPAPVLNNHSIAIQINGNDHFIVDTIIWQYTHVGVEINGAANLLMGVHAWGSGCGRFSYLTGIAVNSWQNRLIGCYLDFNYLDLPQPNSVVVESSFFLGTHTRILGVGAGGSGVVSQLFMQFNLGDSIQLVGNITSATGCYIAHQGGASTVATKAITLTTATQFSFDFTSALLFDAIESVSYSVVATDATSFLPRHVARTPQSKRVVVDFETPVNATVHMTVAQCM
eukprot:m.83959 g.83959  ORF g.83959 m.83959 type:complete len:720 (-) comp25691_c0_seq1:48-2207(-)